MYIFWETGINYLHKLELSKNGYVVNRNDPFCNSTKQEGLWIVWMNYSRWTVPE